MSTPKEQYDQMLDDLDPQTKDRLLNHIPFAHILEEFDPIAYRCGMSDAQAICDDCHDEFWPEDHEDEALCSECRTKREQEELDA